MQIIDFERKGQQVKFYLGDHKLSHYYGDDWNDRPYEHNAGKVYDKYISGERTLTFNWNDIVLEPSDGCDNSPYCKDDMRTRKVPCICVLTEEHQDDWTSYWSFTDIVGNDNAEKFYFGDFLLPDSEVTEFARIIEELAELKRHYGLDKQEAFLKTHANITLNEYAKMLNGRDCQPNLTTEELLLAKQRGFVVVYGDSDDRVEFEGAIREEGHTNPLIKKAPAGTLVLSKDGRLLEEGSEDYTRHLLQNCNVIRVYYYGEDKIPWTFDTKIPHEIFRTYDGGYDVELENDWDEYQRCIVFELSALK